jgi:hypothetical protein
MLFRVCELDRSSRSDDDAGESGFTTDSNRERMRAEHSEEGHLLVVCCSSSKLAIDEDRCIS